MLVVFTARVVCEMIDNDMAAQVKRLGVNMLRSVLRFQGGSRNTTHITEMARTGYIVGSCELLMYITIKL